MFEYTQDIGLLHSALLSAANTNSGSLLNCHDVTDAAKTVHETIRKIIQNAVNGVEDERKKFEIRLHYNEKLHAAVFFTLLRSLGLKSDDAYEFYGSIVHNWPSFDCKFYLQLIYLCDWSEYFIKSALQLSDDMLYEVLKTVTDTSCQIYNFFRHLMVQVFISKVFSIPCEELKFPFDFSSVAKHENGSGKGLKDIKIEKNSNITGECSKVIEQSVNCNGNPLKGKNLSSDVPPPYAQMLCLFLDCVSSHLGVAYNINVLKTLLHALKTFLKCGLVTQSINSLNKLQRSRISSIVSIINKFMQSKTNQDLLKGELQRGPKLFISHAYATSSWSISLNYLFLLLSYYIDEWLSALEENQLSTKKDLTALLSKLNNLNFPFVKTDEYLKLLTNVIQFNLQGSSYIAKIFITDHTLKERKDVLKIVEENCQVVDFVHSYSIIIDNIKNAKSEESKLALLQIFYKCLCGMEISMYDSVLNYILRNYGFTDDFQLPNFNDQLLEFSRVSPTLEKVEKDLPVLFMQNPLTVLKYLIDQVLVQGLEGKVFIQLLAHFPKACMYSKSHDDLCSLHLVLDEYFKKKNLQAYEIKNMITLYKFLAEVHSEKAIFSPWSFFRKCIIPRLQSDYHKIELILECAYILMPVLLKDVNFLMDSEFLQRFIISLGLLVNNFVLTGNGKLKALVLPIFKELETYQMNDEMKLNVQSSLHFVDEMTFAYIEKFLPRNIDYNSKKYIWTWCCRNEDCSNFEEKFSVENLNYILLINTLNEVLPHLTKEEWMFSIKLLKICFKNTNLRHEMILLNNILQLDESESNIYPIALALVHSLHFIINDDAERSSYISSCFSNGLMNLLCQEKNIQTNVLLSIVLEVIYLVTKISADLIQVYSSILLELLKKIIISSSVQLYKENYKKIIFCAIDCLPNSSAKNYLYNKCNI